MLHKLSDVKGVAAIERQYVCLTSEAAFPMDRVVRRDVPSERPYFRGWHRLY